MDALVREGLSLVELSDGRRVGCEGWRGLIKRNGEVFRDLVGSTWSVRNEPGNCLVACGRSYFGAKNTEIT